MSIEAALAENTAALAVHTAALSANTAILEKLEAGREAAIAQLEQKADKPATRSRKKADEAPAGAVAGDAAGSAAEETSAVAGETATVSDDDIRNAAIGYVQGTAEKPTTAEERKVRGANVKSITDHFGTKTLVGPDGINDPDQRTQALFYLGRFNAGCEVNFSAEYDFSGDPAQGAVAAEADFDAIG